MLGKERKVPQAVSGQGCGVSSRGGLPEGWGWGGRRHAGPHCQITFHFARGV